ncbi:histidinol phosphatase [Marinilongibacter aquaticus]|uniref:tyrosine-protein phosphatase n=1 Tax=Marinilongibacter aquaticus TaxID=2975157 RepID=UPI0021BD8FEB|nr:CpsB/CapC family capsule biosynthesis tyrosine phosphatase [Marinilongibacter aquaticus]UBM58087.1 histidinol phosphatase [Marinilongibacter aquaticus]
MFDFFFKKRNIAGAYSFLGTDFHSHLLPGVDDGSDSVETSLKLIDGLHELGFEKIVTSPHIHHDFYRNSPETLSPAYQLVLNELHTEKANFHFAAEYFFDSHFENQMDEQAPLLTFGPKRILIELPFVAYNPRFEQAIFELVSKNYKPILAHPERYLYLKHKLQTFARLRELGCEFQINLLSLGGYYGEGSFEMGKSLLQHGYADYLCTDMHHERHLNFIRHMATKRKTMKLISQHTWKNTEILS